MRPSGIADKSLAKFGIRIIPFGIVKNRSIDFILRFFFIQNAIVSNFDNG